MQTRLIELHQQRGRLVERVAMQRNTLSRELVPLRRAFSLSERIAQVGEQCKGFVQRQPLAIAAAVAVIVLFKPRTLLRWAQRALVGWRTWRTVHALVPTFLANLIRDRL